MCTPTYVYTSPPFPSLLLSALYENDAAKRWMHNSNYMTPTGSISNLKFSATETFIQVIPNFKRDILRFPSQPDLQILVQFSNMLK